MNAFGFDMIAALDNALEIAERDESKAIVIGGNKKLSPPDLTFL